MSWLHLPLSLASGFFKGFWKWLAILFFIAAPPWFVYVLCRDLRHPETWSDWTHNPCVYLPMYVIVMVLGMALLTKAWLNHKPAVR